MLFAVGLLALSVVLCAISPSAIGHGIHSVSVSGMWGREGHHMCMWGCLEPLRAQGQRHQLNNSCSDGCGVLGGTQRLASSQEQQRKAGRPCSAHHPTPGFIRLASKRWFHTSNLYTGAARRSDDTVKHCGG